MPRNKNQDPTIQALALATKFLSLPRKERRAVLSFLLSTAVTEDTELAGLRLHDGSAPFVDPIPEAEQVGRSTGE